jgi:Tfp pilus assembly PilM family ATPase
MGRTAGAAIGLDLGNHTFKAALLQRRGSKITLSGYSTRVVQERSLEPDQLSHHVKLLLNDLGGTAKHLSVAYGGSDTLIRIIDQPPTPPEMLRTALRINGKMLLHQDVQGYVLDCDLLAPELAEVPPDAAEVPQQPYLVGGTLRDNVDKVHAAMGRIRAPIKAFQLAPIALLNAFEFAYPEVYASESFLLIDIGHHTSTVLVGGKGQLRLVRSIDYGGLRLIRDLTLNDAMDRESAMMLAEQGDAGMIEATRESLQTAGREITSSIGFFEGRFEQTVSRVHVSGAASRLEMVLSTLSDIVNLPCERWNASEKCEINLPKGKRSSFAEDAWDLNIAVGAAVEALTAK